MPNELKFLTDNLVLKPNRKGQPNITISGLTEIEDKTYYVDMVLLSGREWWFAKELTPELTLEILSDPKSFDYKKRLKDLTESYYNSSMQSFVDYFELPDNIRMNIEAIKSNPSINND